LPPVSHKKVSAAFDGGAIGSDGGVFLLVGVDKRLGLIDRLAVLIPDCRDPGLPRSRYDRPFRSGNCSTQLKHRSAR
jgi:hypothetical protein